MFDTSGVRGIAKALHRTITDLNKGITDRCYDRRSMWDNAINRIWSEDGKYEPFQRTSVVKIREKEVPVHLVPNMWNFPLVVWFRMVRHSIRINQNSALPLWPSLLSFFHSLQGQWWRGGSQSPEQNAALFASVVGHSARPDILTITISLQDICFRLILRDLVILIEQLGWAVELMSCWG